MSDAAVQKPSAVEVERERLASEAYTADKMRRAATLAEHARAQAARASERASLMQQPVAAVSLGFQTVEVREYNGIRMERLGAGGLRIIFENQSVDALELPEALWKAAAPVVPEKLTTDTAIAQARKQAEQRGLSQ